MAQVVVMPKLGNTVESCIIVKWNIEEGQAVAADAVLCEIETDKATMDVPAGAAGVLLKRLAAEGDDVPVLAPIAVVGQAGEAVDFAALGIQGTAAPAAAQAAEAAPAQAAAQAAEPAPAAVAAAPAAAVPAASGPVHASPRAKALAREEGLPIEAVAAGTGPGGRIIERDVRAALSAGPGMTASAKDLAVLRGLYDAAKTGSGLGGRLTAADLEAAKAAPAAAAATAAAAPAASAQPAAAFPGPYEDTPIRSIRKIIADRMMHSLQASAQLTFNASAPAEKLLAMRNRLKNSDPALGLSAVTIGDMVAFAASRVLAKYPKINAHVVDGTVRAWKNVHLGLAVDTPRGLMVPVIRNAQLLSLRQFSEQSKSLAKACLDGNANPDNLSGSTFTVTNLGAFGIESFTPILNEPETGILGVDNIAPRAAIGPDGKPGVEMRIGFSLTVDHRIVDGADAARYLKDLADYIANIDIVMLA
jgi:pyruvate dehydrogenase E2 component (dihydrolipoamide acetyltransferase)